MAELERIYNIPLRREWEKAPRIKRAKKAVKALREFLVRHMKIRDRDLTKIKIQKYLNHHIWERGIKKPPAKIKVKAVKEGEIVKAELAQLPTSAIREQKKIAELKAKEEAEKKKKENINLKVPFKGKNKETKPEEKKETLSKSTEENKEQKVIEEKDKKESSTEDEKVETKEAKEKTPSTN